MHQRKNIKQALNQSDDFGEDQKEFESFMDEGKPLNLTVGPSSSASDEKDDKKKKEKRNLTSEKKNEPEIMEEIDITGEEIKQRRKPSTRKPKQNPSGSCCSEGSICGLPNYDENDKGIKWLPLFFLAIFVFPLFITIGDWLMQQDFMKSFVPAPTHHYLFMYNSSVG